MADGGKLVDRWTVYNKPTTDSHYMALAVKPAADAGDSGDFHFWKLDADKTWSYKVRSQTVLGCPPNIYLHRLQKYLSQTPLRLHNKFLMVPLLFEACLCACDAELCCFTVSCRLATHFPATPTAMAR